MELPGADPEGPLGRGLSKLAGALSDAGLEAFPDETAGVAIDLARPVMADDLTAAVADGAEVTINYYSPARDESNERLVVPRHVFVESGNWYVIADDDKSGERRTFRIDRIERIARTGKIEPTADIVTAPEAFFADAELPRATLQLGPSAQWIIDQYPSDDVHPIAEPQDWVEVRLPVANERWLARLLIRLGPHARVVEPSDARAAAARLAARMLANY